MTYFVKLIDEKFSVAVNTLRIHRKSDRVQNKGINKNRHENKRKERSEINYPGNLKGH